MMSDRLYILFGCLAFGFTLLALSLWSLSVRLDSFSSAVPNFETLARNYGFVVECVEEVEVEDYRFVDEQKEYCTIEELSNGWTAIVCFDKIPALVEYFNRSVCVKESLIRLVEE